MADPSSFANSFSLPDLAKYKNVPALVPPKGVTQNFAAHNGQADLYIVLCSISLALVYLFIALRMYSKIWVNRTPGIDDCERDKPSTSFLVLTDD